MSVVADRLRGKAAPYLADQFLSSSTNFLAIIMVARKATPTEFGLFSILLVTFIVIAGFNRSVPHAVAMTLTWDDQRAQSGYFFLPPLAIGLVATPLLMAVFTFLGRSPIALPIVLLPLLLLQDAVRMHAFAIQTPHVALLSDAAWLGVELLGFVLVSSSAGAAWVWGIGGVSALVVTRPWRIRLRIQFRPVKTSVTSAALEYATLVGLGYLTPLLASPIISVRGVGALQGANVIKGPITLFVQGLMLHRMAGPPIARATSLREAIRLSGTTLIVTLLSCPALFLLRGFYGPRMLGATWPEVEPLVLPALLTLGVGSAVFGPATVVRKMGRFVLSAKVQGAAAPLFFGLPLVGAAIAGTSGFLYATALAFGISGLLWWTVLLRVSSTPTVRVDPAAT